jgi:plastocyanin domain-containing protein
MDKVIVTTLGIVSIAVIYWFFFGKKEEGGETAENLTVTVDGGYKPSVIRVKKNVPVTLTFIRKDANPCLEDVIIPEYKIKKYLPLNEPVTITLSPPHHASRIHCGMNMFHGKIEVIG